MAKHASLSYFLVWVLDYSFWCSGTQDWSGKSLLYFGSATWSLCLFSGHQTVSPGRLGLASPQGSLPCPGVSGPSAHGGSHASSMLPRCLVFPSVSAKRTAGCGGGGLTHLFSPVSNVAFISEQNLFSAKVRGITEEKGKLSEFDFKDAYTEFLCSTEVVTEFFLRLLIYR